MKKVVCPSCSQDVQPVSYGGGWVWVCCGKVLHSAARSDVSRHEEAGGGSGTTDAKT